MLATRYADQFDQYLEKREAIRSAAAEYAQRADNAELDVIYRFGEAVIDDAELSISSDGINIPGFAREIVFEKENPWSDMASTDNALKNKPQTAEID